MGENHPTLDLRILNNNPLRATIFSRFGRTELPLVGATSYKTEKVLCWQEFQ